MNHTKDIEVATAILDQLGGHRFIAMTGSYNFISDTNSLLMHLRRNRSGSQYLKITLNGMDTYDLTFTRFNRNQELIVVKELNGYYDDMLQQAFTEVTGMATHL